MQFFLVLILVACVQILEHILKIRKNSKASEFRKPFAINSQTLRISQTVRKQFAISTQVAKFANQLALFISENVAIRFSLKISLA